MARTGWQGRGQHFPTGSHSPPLLRQLSRAGWSSAFAAEVEFSGREDGQSPAVGKENTSRLTIDWIQLAQGLAARSAAGLTLDLKIVFATQHRQVGLSALLTTASHPTSLFASCSWSGK